MSTETSTRLSEQFRERIEESILTGTFCPGMRLDEMELAKMYGASRTPIREALIQLSTMGLIVKRPRKGWEVTEFSPTRLCEMFEVMAELEAMCGRLAARRATVEEQAQILQAHEACKQAWESNDPKEYYKLNEVFHHAVYAASHNSFLEERAELLHRRLRPYRRLQLHVRNRMRNSFDEHEKIVRALLDGNSTLAADLLRAHVVVQGEKFTDLMSNMDSLKKPELAGAA